MQASQGQATWLNEGIELVFLLGLLYPLLYLSPVFIFLNVLYLLLGWYKDYKVPNGEVEFEMENIYSRSRLHTQDSGPKYIYVQGIKCVGENTCFKGKYFLRATAAFSVSGLVNEFVSNRLRKNLLHTFRGK